ncbi:hypothetical protein FRC12_020748 [Ceratobasidium sp. 428]|nr:hypothetical protein FRC09_019584 [Ceratobasidium sp. 395]KAG8685278.1 hypothetical protein FRC09_014854 [Ceratobasidium sp. 395]KAG8729749.1 hypothetical protein FRC12_020748 [Ceratobasidium sp. 428]
MPRAATEKTEKKTKSSTSAAAGGAKKKSSPYNVYMKSELAKLKEKHPDMSHKERFKLAATTWAQASENPKNQK